MFLIEIASHGSRVTLFVALDTEFDQEIVIFYALSILYFGDVGGVCAH